MARDAHRTTFQRREEPQIIRLAGRMLVGATLSFGPGLPRRWRA